MTAHPMTAQVVPPLADTPLADSHHSTSDSTPTGDAFLSSGSSPTVHVVGLGKVGRALLRHLEDFRVVGVSDRSATCFVRNGVDCAAIARLKHRGGRLVERDDAAAVSLRVALSLVAADFVIDCTDTDRATGEAALARSLEILDSGARLVLASKAAMSLAASELLDPVRRRRIGINAVLGGTGRALIDDLERLRKECTRAVLVPNATTTCIIHALERGADFDEALRSATRRGLAESDPSSDLDGRDAAAKLAIVADAVFGVRVDQDRLSLPSLEELDLDLLRARYRSGLTTRLVARIEPAAVRLRYEAVPRGSTLAVPQTHVVYAYQVGPSRRVHVGAGIGADGTARAILDDLHALCAGGQ